MLWQQDSNCVTTCPVPLSYGSQFDQDSSECQDNSYASESLLPFYQGGGRPSYFSSVKYYQRSLGVDPEGRVFISQEIPHYEPQYIFPVGISGHFNVLSSGVIGELTGLPNESIYHGPIGVK